MISKIHQEVEQTAAKLKRVRQLPSQTRPQKLRVFFFYEQCKVRAAKQADPGTWSMDKWEEFRAEIRRQWGNLSPQAKDEWERLLIVARAGRPMTKRPAPVGLGSNRASKRVRSTAGSMGSETRPLADEVLDRHPDYIIYMTFTAVCHTKGRVF